MDRPGEMDKLVAKAVAAMKKMAWFRDPTRGRTFLCALPEQVDKALRPEAHLQCHADVRLNRDEAARSTTPGQLFGFVSSPLTPFRHIHPECRSLIRDLRHVQRDDQIRPDAANYHGRPRRSQARTGVTVWAGPRKHLAAGAIIGAGQSSAAGMMLVLSGIQFRSSWCSRSRRGPTGPSHM
jgi:hypothetical protein